MDDLLILGAGITGLAAANHLKDHASSIRILDKGRGVGGRLATRRIQQHGFDSGAQFFSARSPGFSQAVADLVAAGVVKPWTTGILDPNRGLVDDGLTRYRCQSGMTQLAKHLATQIPAQTILELSCEVVALEEQGGAWTATLSDGEVRQARTVLSTIPVPQLLALLRNGGAILPPEAMQKLTSISYDPCLCLLLDYPENGPALPSPGAMRCDDPQEPVAWILSHAGCGVRTQGEGLTVHLRGSWSRSRYPAKDAPDEPLRSECFAVVKETLAKWCGPGLDNPGTIELKRWKFAHCTTPHAEEFLSTNINGARLLVAGDAWGAAPRVEGAWRSGVAAGQYFLDTLTDAKDV